ncbi:unnamed protein product [Rhodiola kirilowii]
MSTNWSNSEDVQLCISYCRQSVDPITGRWQKVDKLWEKIHIDFQQNWVRGEHEVRTIERSQAALASRFAKLKPILVFWGSCLSYARRNSESGCNLQDELRKAQTMYVAKKKKTFTHFECWEQVKEHQPFTTVETNTPPAYLYEANPVFEELHTSEALPNPSIEEQVFTTPESNPVSPSSPIRPLGVKAAKEARRKGKNVANKSHNEALMSLAESQKQYLNGNQQKMDEDGQRQQQFLDLKQKQMEDDREMQLREFNLRQMEENTKIVQMNTDIMTPKSKRYFSKRKAAILRQYEEEEDNNDLGASEDFSNCYRPQNLND